MYNYKILPVPIIELVKPPQVHNKLREMDRVRVAIRLLSMKVILWIILIWIMMPTGAYREQWWPNIKATVNSTYFGGQGSLIIVYSFCF